MRIAALSDIHGNLPALDAVLADIARRGADCIVNLGDIVSGPLWPRETLDRLLPLELPTIAGNHERQLLGEPAALAPSDAHARQALRPAQLDWLRALPALLRLDDVLLCHGTPGSDVDYLLDDIAGAELRAAEAATVAARLAHPLAADASLVLCGHSHTPRATRLADGRLACNPGSVGLPAFATSRPVPHRAQAGSPEARYALLERRDGQWRAQLLSVPYRYEAAAMQAGRLGRPDWVHALRHGRMP
ncbi:metallophosphatase family protein [Pseudoxanthomonas daejeonensis]|uniref:metallophosphoesterase family protein n=1 Tax=Pseudoxanthomonas daejeonensis TaxID=266062 RepID=UPI001F53E618|nr:metallophosphoesterase family protein [Pseudoxanthomonas daejeonensis]UNK57583.1 metallophosphatase family protein [Pseudoxanthomonas daejeonensis]